MTAYFIFTIQSFSDNFQFGAIWRLKQLNSFFFSADGTFEIRKRPNNASKKINCIIKNCRACEICKKPTGISVCPKPICNW